MNTKCLDNVHAGTCHCRCCKLGPDRIFPIRPDCLIFGNMSWISRIIYALVGISGLYLISVFGRIRSIGDEEA